MLKKIAYVAVAVSILCMSGCCVTCGLTALVPIVAAVTALAAGGTGTVGN